MFELFDQYEQNHDSDYADDPWGVDDLNYDDSMDFASELGAASDPYSPFDAVDNPFSLFPQNEYDSFELNDYYEDDFIRAIEEMSDNGSGYHNADFNADSPEDFSPFDFDQISDFPAYDDPAVFHPFMPYNESSIDAADSINEYSAYDDSPFMDPNEYENQRFADDSAFDPDGLPYEPYPYDQSNDVYQQSIYDDAYVPQTDSGFSADYYPIDNLGAANPTENQDFLDSLNDWISDFWTFFSNGTNPVQPTRSLVSQDQFSQSPEGYEFDSKNGLIVDGNVCQDIDFLSQQTHSSCSLMAQEQFVSRYYGESVSESILERLMGSYGVYDPESGTVYEGQTMVLDTFNIPYERNSSASIDDLVDELNANHDCIIGVDARYFYNDPSIPPGSGHAVTVVGKGIDPVSSEIKGFYITDSNYPGAAHYIDVDTLSNVWYNDVISVPNPGVLN